jgi:hypothetical protein
MEAIRDFYIITTPRQNTRGILMVGIQHPLHMLPTRPSAIGPPNNINKPFNYFELYFIILQCLVRDTISICELAKELTTQQVTLIHNKALTKLT